MLHVWSSLPKWGWGGGGPLQKFKKTWKHKKVQRVQVFSLKC